MSFNLLITPNVIINCLLQYKQEHQSPTYDFFLDKIVESSERHGYSIFMTEIDLEVVTYYYSYFESLLDRRSEIINTGNDDSVAETRKTLKLFSSIRLIERYINIAQEYPIDEDIFNLATYIHLNNPSDALRLATAIASEKLDKRIRIDAIITWEPPHFCQDTDDYYAIRKSGYGKFKAVIDSKYGADNEKIEIIKDIYTPGHFPFSELTKKNKSQIQTFFEITNINIQSNICSPEQTSENRVDVSIKYNDEIYKYRLVSNSGIVSTLLLAIHICVKKECLKKDKAKRKCINKKLIREMIYSVSPVRGDNNQIHTDIIISGKNIKDLQATHKGSNLLCSTGEAYIKILNQAIGISMATQSTIWKLDGV